MKSIYKYGDPSPQIELEERTSIKLCKDLSIFIGRPVEYLYESKQFAIRCSNGWYKLVKLESNGKLTFDTSYTFTPSLIIQIGLFYSGISWYIECDKREAANPTRPKAPTQPNPKPSPGSLKKLTEGVDIEAVKNQSKI